MGYKVALVVPSFEDAGGVPAVADFILRTISRRPDLDAKVVSLATSSKDPCSLLISDPRTWATGVRSRTGRARGKEFTHIGAFLGELEFQRLKPRKGLAELVHDCDLIHVKAGAPSWAGPVLGLGKPTIVHAATLTAVERRAAARAESGPKAVWRRAMTRIVSRQDDAALRRADAVIVQNPWMQAYARKLAPEGAPVVYGPPGVDADLFSPAASDVGRGSYILSVGRFSDVRKNPMLLLRAYAMLARHSDASPALLIAGADGPPPTFWLEAERLGLRNRIQVVEKPSRETLADLYRHASCFVLPSDEEGFGMVVIEAMASGIPVVATRSGGPDGIIDDGVDGYLVDLNDPEAIADRLLRLTIDSPLRREMGRRARLKVETRFSEQIAGAVYLSLYEQLLTARRPAAA